MEIIGITGGIGSGKSAAMSILEEKFGARIMLADKLGHLSMLKDSAPYKAMIDAFGTKILDEDEEIDRCKLAAIVLSSKENLEIQNKIVHPFVINIIKSQLEAWRKEGVKLAVVESAVLVQSGCDSLCDEVWAVTAPREIRARRLKADRGYTDTQTEAFMKNQQSDEVYLMQCNRQVCNDGDIENLYKELRKCVEQIGGM